MGIQGLLPFLKKIHTPVNIAKFRGCTVAIDAYCWLHKGAFSCAEKLALGEKTDQYVYYCMKYLDYMLKNNLKPIMVFDGCHLKSKADVEKTRRERRELHRKKAAQFLREGRRAEAKECLQRCVDITSQMALELMNVCRERGVDCIVAPYEADAQLAYLNLAGIAQVIVTEDSDLLLFGCDKIIFKLDFFGNGTLIEKSRLNEVMDTQGGFYTFDKFRYMCILSGCDYLPSLHGIGLAKANKVFRIARQDDIRLVLKKLPTYLKMNLVVSDDYVEGFVRANNTFLYQLCFDPLTRQLCPLTPYLSGMKVEELDYAGEYLPPSKAYQIALGNVDIHDHKRIADFDPDNFVPKYPLKVKYRYELSIWDKNYKIQSSSPCKEIQNANETEKQSLHNKEVAIKFNLLKRSPQKRVRDLPDEGPTKSELVSLYEGDNDDDDDDDDDGINEPNVKRVRKNLLESLGEVSGNKAQEKKSSTKNQWKNDEEPVPLADESESDSDVENGSGNSTPVKRNQRTHTQRSSAAIIGENAFKEDEQVETRKVTPRKERNMFAVPAGSTKPQKFDLSACAMQVKSRYFTGSAPTRSPTSSSLSKKSKTSASSNSSIRLMFEKVSQKTVKKEEEAVEKEPITPPSLTEISTRTKSEKGPKSIKDIFENLKASKENNPTQLVERKEKIDVADNNVSTFNKFSSSFSKKKPSPASAFSWSRFKLNKESQSPSWSAPRQKAETSECSKTAATKKSPQVDLAAIGSSSEDKISPHPVSQTSPERGASVSSLSGSKFFSQNLERKVSSSSTPRGNKDEDSLSSSDVCVMESLSYGDFISTMTTSASIATKGDDDDDEQVDTDSQTSLAPEDSASQQQLVGDGSQGMKEEEREGSQIEENAETSGTMSSQRSFLGSIDSFCLQGSQDFIDLTDTEFDSQKSTLSTASKSSSLSGQSNCRVSGLSRSKKSKSRSRSCNETGQQNIKDLFSKFAFRKEKSKPDEDEDVTEMTPVVKKLHSSEAGTIQRKLQI